MGSMVRRPTVNASSRDTSGGDDEPGPIVTSAKLLFGTPVGVQWVESLQFPGPPFQVLRVWASDVATRLIKITDPIKPVAIAE
jgi:hypothetical protein